MFALFDPHPEWVPFHDPWGIWDSFSQISVSSVTFGCCTRMVGAGKRFGTPWEKIIGLYSSGTLLGRLRTLSQKKRKNVPTKKNRMNDMNHEILGICWNYSPPSNSHHQDYSILSRKSLYINLHLWLASWVGGRPKVYDEILKTNGFERYLFLRVNWVNCSLLWEVTTTSMCKNCERFFFFFRGFQGPRNQRKKIWKQIQTKKNWPVLGISTKIKTT